jgi:hypothetical protein
MDSRYRDNRTIMSTIQGKPRGYFEKILAMDCETTGLAVNRDDPSFNPDTGEEYQSVSWGFIVANAQTLQPIEKMYLEIQWNGTSVWDSRAQKIHGLSKEHLQQNGFTELEAVEAIGTLIMKHWGPTVRIGTLGHNVATFDLWFLKRLFRRHGIELSFGSRHVDTSSIGFVNWNVFTSDQLFEAVGFDARGDHNALADAEMSLDAARMTKEIFNKCIDND